MEEGAPRSAAAAAPAAAKSRLEPPGVNPMVRQLLVNPPAKPSIGPVPRSSVLGRLQRFLPQMAAANAQLEEQVQDGADVVIEQPEDAEDEGAPHVQMDLLCGVYDLRDNAAVRAAETTIAAGPDVVVEPFDPGSSSDSDSETDSGVADLTRAANDADPSSSGQQEAGSSKQAELLTSSPGRDPAQLQCSGSKPAAQATAAAAAQDMEVDPGPAVSTAHAHAVAGERAGRGFVAAAGKQHRQQAGQQGSPLIQEL